MYAIGFHFGHFSFTAIATPVQPEIRARLEAAAKEMGLKYDET